MIDLPRHRHVISVMALLAAAVAACDGNSRSGLRGGDGGPGATGGKGSGADAGVGADASTGPDGMDSGPPAGTGGTAAGGAGTGGRAGGGGSSGTGGSVVLNCVPGSAPRVPATPFRRLSNFEYNNTVRDIFGDASRPADTLPFDGYWSQRAWASEAPISGVQAEDYWRLAREQALRATKDAESVRALAKCDPLTVGEAACQKTFVEGFLLAVFRRPPSADDMAEFDAVFLRGRQLTGAFAGGVRAVIEVALQSPEFLYRLEFAEPATMPSQPARLTSFELATRLSYLLWGSSPDPLLLDAAAHDQLKTKEQIAVQARRLLADSRAQDVVRYFYRQLFDLRADNLIDAASRMEGDAFTPELPALLLKETDAFIDEVTWNGAGDLRNLLTAPYTFANARLAQYYGIPGITGEPLQRVTLPASQRAGLLTQGSLLVSTSHGSTSTNPVTRGKLIFERLLCGTVRIEPPIVVIPPIVDLPPTATTRERFAQHLTDPQCRECHQDLDPLGFAFEHFDGFGIWRDTENGRPIDATGEIFTTDARGTFDGALELIARLVQSRDVQNCYVNNWMAFGFARQVAAEDACSVQSLQDAFVRNHGSVPELLVALTQIDAFLYKATP